MITNHYYLVDIKQDIISFQFLIEAKSKSEAAILADEKVRKIRDSMLSILNDDALSRYRFTSVDLNYSTLQKSITCVPKRIVEKHSFDLFKKHLKEVSKRVEGWPDWMKLGGRATMGLL